MNTEPTIGEEAELPPEAPLAPVAETPRRRGRPPNSQRPQPPDLENLAAPEESDEVVYAEEDPRTRAARRAAELRDHRGSMDEGTDEFYIDPRIIPAGWSYEWKRHSTLGAEDPAYQVKLSRDGWDSVPRRRHMEMMPDNYVGNTILRKGMILMERPLEITNESKARDLRVARSQVQQKEAQLSGAPSGTFERDNKGSKLASITKSYEHMPIPKD